MKVRIELDLAEAKKRVKALESISHILFVNSLIVFKNNIDLEIKQYEVAIAIAEKHNEAYKNTTPHFKPNL